MPDTDPLPTIHEGVLLAWTLLYVELTFKNLGAIGRWHSWGKLTTDDFNPTTVATVADLLKNPGVARYVADRPFTVLVHRQTGALIAGPIAHSEMTWGQVKARAATLRARIRGVR